MSYYWFLAVPFGMGLIGEALYQISWLLAAKKGFKYDDEKSEATWNEDGKRVTYKWPNKVIS